MLALGAWIEPEERMKADIVVLCEAGCRWLVDDGMRVGGTFRMLLDGRGIHYVVIPKDVNEPRDRAELVKRG
ncbi:hypothetical protein CC78DRAFT_535286 [Lojkania enalia]|uniref:Uncharacterized protein n=1 Tax=Lojkania enalia TaxID=147567 RepID=A0A9P4MY00_9PLEO|nr:hypothetical protein CC78DRAFT_535286 [Didymosphaeria enalia]